MAASGHGLWQRVTTVTMLAVMVTVLAACGAQPGGTPGAGGAGAAGPDGAGSAPISIIDYVNVVRLQGITYSEAQRSGRELTPADLGPEVGKVKFTLQGGGKGPDYQLQDGDATFLPAGTSVHSVKGYSPTFRVAAQWDGRVVLYESDTNPTARTGADWLDIDGRVEYIGINSETDGTTELGAIRDPEQVGRLVDLVLAAPVPSAGPAVEGDRYFIAFHLTDGTQTVRAYWPQTGRMGRGIQLPEGFGAAVKAAVAQTTSGG